MHSRATVFTALLTGLCATTVGARTPLRDPVRAHGDYLEARTCSVYTGACHANGEAVTIGREAILAWHFTTGATNGASLAGLNAAAVVAGSQNLAWGSGERRSLVFVDSRATAEQRKAIASEIESRYAEVLGAVESVNPAAIQFAHSGLEYAVRIAGVLEVKTTRYACDHCIMPHQVWYDPFIPLRSSLVAKTSVSEFEGAPGLDVSWLRHDENSSFVGEF